MKKRVFSWLLIVALLISIVPTVLADDPTTALPDGTTGTTALHATADKANIVTNTTDGSVETYVFVCKHSFGTVLNSILAKTELDGKNGTDIPDANDAYETLKASDWKFAVNTLSLTGLADGEWDVYGWTANKPADNTLAKTTVTLKDGKIQAPQCTITWDLDGGNGNTTGLTSQDQGADLKAPTVTKKNYTFAGWVDVDNGNAAVDLDTAKVPTAATANYKATWTLKPDAATPTDKTATYKNGLTLADVALETGWVWDAPTTKLTTVGDGTYPATYSETSANAETKKSVKVTVNKGAITVTGTAQGRIGKTLAESGIVLADVVTVKDAASGVNHTLTPDTIEWVNDAAVITAGEQTVQVNVTLKTADDNLYTVAGPYSIKITGQDKNPTNFTGVKDLTGKVGDTVELNITASSGKPVSFESNKPDIVKVDGNKLTYLAEGEVEITVSVEGDADWAANTATFKVTVSSAADPHDPFMFGRKNEDGTITKFGPDDQLSRAEAVTILARLKGWKDGQEVEVSDMFSDVKEKDAKGNDIWYYDAVCFAKKNGITEGKEDGTFGPDDNITRAEFTKMLASMDDAGKKPTGADASLADAKTHWANKWIGYVETNYPGSITGRETGKFDPNDEITRAEVAKIVNGYLGRLQSVSAKEEDQLDEDLNIFDDVKRCTWYYNNVVEATVQHDAADPEFHTAG